MFVVFVHACAYIFVWARACELSGGC